MANVVHGPFVKGAATATGSYGTGVGQSNTYTSGNANNDETQSSVALASFNPDLVGAGFILSGVACVKDATTAAQLNITSGEAYLVMTDGTTARIDVASATQSATGHPSVTLLLDLNPDGSWSWGTSHSAQANYLPICAVTTDASANIATVTDTRATLASLLSGAAHPSVAQPGGALLPSPLAVATTQSASLAGSVQSGVTFGQTGALGGSMDGAALFNGSTGFVSTPAAASATPLPSGTAAWSLECWLKFASAPGADQCVLALGANATGQEALVDVQATTGKIYVAVNGGTQIITGAGVAAGAWHHVVVTYDSTSIRLYVDGALAAGPTAPGVTVNMGQSGFWLGVRAGLTQFFSGTLDECALYASALSSARVTAHYSAGTSTTSDGYAAAVLADSPLRYYRLGDAAGATTAAATTAPTAMTLTDATGAVYATNLTVSRNVTVTGALASVGGQATVGSFGVPVIVAQAIRVHVTVTTQVAMLAYTAQASGIYEVTLYFELNNGTSGQIITAQLFGTDPDTNGTSGAFFTVNAGGPTVLGNSNNLVNGSYPCYVIPIAAKASTTINVTYQDHGGTPSDFVSAFIKRLS